MHRRWRVCSSPSSTCPARPPCSPPSKRSTSPPTGPAAPASSTPRWPCSCSRCCVAAWGGVLFGADPLTGRHDRMVVAAVPGGPDELVSGATDGWTGVLDRRGRVVEVRSTGDAPRPPVDVLRRLARLAQDAGRAFAAPQDIEWAVDADGALHLLQARPITTLPPTSGTVFGPGPIAETFPDPLATLEQALWLDPLRDGLREALLLTGTSPARTVRASKLVVAVDGFAAADLALLGVDGRRRGLLRRFDPRPPARRLRAAWRVGRLRSALPALATDLVGHVDADLAAVPAPGELSDEQLLAVLVNGRRTLVSLHGHEALVGLLIPSAAAATVTGASLAFDAISRTRHDSLSLDELVALHPVVLALVPPRIGGDAGLGELVAAAPTEAAAAARDADAAAIAREALRLRIRWVQELMARTALELGARLVTSGTLRRADDVRDLRWDELDEAMRRPRVRVPAFCRGLIAAQSSLAARALGSARPARPLPSRRPRPSMGRRRATTTARGRRRARSVPAAARSTAPVHVHDGVAEIPDGHVLVVAHLDPRLAAVIPRLAGLIAETGSPLSHLAILAREHGVPTVVGLAGATTRFADGDVVAVDGHAGTVTPVESEPTLDRVEVAA